MRSVRALHSFRFYVASFWALRCVRVLLFALSYGVSRGVLPVPPLPFCVFVLPSTGLGSRVFIVFAPSRWAATVSPCGPTERAYVVTCLVPVVFLALFLISLEVWAAAWPGVLAF